MRGFTLPLGISAFASVIPLQTCLLMSLAVEATACCSLCPLALAWALLLRSAAYLNMRSVSALTQAACSLRSLHRDPVKDFRQRCAPAAVYIPYCTGSCNNCRSGRSTQLRHWSTSYAGHCRATPDPRPMAAKATASAVSSSAHTMWAWLPSDAAGSAALLNSTAPTVAHCSVSAATSTQAKHAALLPFCMAVTCMQTRTVTHHSSADMPAESLRLQACGNAT